MSKQRLKTLIIKMLVSGIVLIGMIIIIVNDIMPTFPGIGLLLAMYIVTIYIITLASIIVFVSTIRQLIATKRIIQIKEKLSSEFFNVKLKETKKSAFTEKMQFRAKLDENNKIILVLKANAEIETDDYEWFLQYFEF